MTGWSAKNVEWVVKISKLCNLRCTYCYEYPFLADRSRMGLAQLQRMFEHIAEFYSGRRTRMDFVWHGGEPLLVEPAYYEAILRIQTEVFSAADVPFTNSVQTNLTVLNTDVLAFLKSGMVANIGVSLDLFGDQRVNLAQRSSQPTVLANMQRLIDEGVTFGCITVLSRANMASVEKMYRFFEDIDTSFRLLPIYRTGYPGQQEPHALRDEEIVETLCKVVDLWLASDSSIQVRPIQDYIANVVGHLAGEAPPIYYDKEADEVVYIVEPDGSLYSVADPPDTTLCHGNIFQSPLSALKQTDGYLRAVEAARTRMDVACRRCPYHGTCSGYFMGEATPEQRTVDADGKLRCGVAQPVQEYIERTLKSVGFPRTSGMTSSHRLPTSNPESLSSMDGDRLQ